MATFKVFSVRPLVSNTIINLNEETLADIDASVTSKASQQ